jgi:hypothetical protein
MGLLAATQDPEVSARMDAHALARPAHCRPARPRGDAMATRASACCAPSPGARTPRACSACRAATRSRAGACSVYRARSRALSSSPCISTRSFFGEVDDEALQAQVRRDCERAFHGRLVGRLLEGMVVFFGIFETVALRDGCPPLQTSLARTGPSAPRFTLRMSRSSTRGSMVSTH